MRLWFISYIPFCDRLSTFIALLSECGTPTSTAAKTLQLGCMRVCVSVCGKGGHIDLYKLSEASKA